MLLCKTFLVTWDTFTVRQNFPIFFFGNFKFRYLYWSRAIIKSWTYGIAISIVHSPVTPKVFAVRIQNNFASINILVCLNKLKLQHEHLSVIDYCLTQNFHLFLSKDGCTLRYGTLRISFGEKVRYACTVRNTCGSTGTGALVRFWNMRTQRTNQRTVPKSVF